ncbi:GntR family transcriptional regulator [Pseudonocardia nigra]|uniref:GntR family transcriptional regulator n=1 Tax=Pseudonocardia nigra TaxID=1921578 RepID=UPI001C5D8FD3|nr:GntR family transcriptional regulator [Pseudonocardia nigra]
MKLQRHSTTPLYRQVEQELRRRVEAGELRPGDRLPPESALAAELQVNRLTVRQAIGELCRAGTLHSRQGIGTFVTERQPAAEITIHPSRHEVATAAAAWATTAADAGAHEHVLGVGIDRDAGARAELRLDTALWRVDTLVSHADRPWLVSSYWLAEQRFPDLPAALAEHGSPIDALLRHYGLVLRYAWRSFAAGAAGAADAADLDVLPGSPLLLREGLNHDAEGVPTVFVRRRCRSDRVRFVLRYGGDGPHEDVAAPTDEFPPPGPSEGYDR